MMSGVDSVLRAMAADPFHYPLFATHRADFDRVANDAAVLDAAFHPPYTPKHRALVLVKS